MASKEVEKSAVAFREGHSGSVNSDRDLHWPPRWQPDDHFSINTESPEDFLVEAEPPELAHAQKIDDPNRLTVSPAAILSCERRATDSRSAIQGRRTIAGTELPTNRGRAVPGVAERRRGRESGQAENERSVNCAFVVLMLPLAVNPSSARYSSTSRITPILPDRSIAAGPL